MGQRRLGRQLGRALGICSPPKDSSGHATNDHGPPHRQPSAQLVEEQGDPTRPCIPVDLSRHGRRIM
ncbi:hypothetical protein DCS_06147 [Drechmeria coniospora]|uniref:Uncharacterized protein n=1 Tax=Drechmeria coniospora TaxID=98403 RepID=A0A151GAS2_DRECN|nr:hypothetical protein DCS_06147 [Drechmeria coniospora]KYK54190.1 hypothetical protein DCS_06147 [Drechmeria coniospora]